MIKIVHNLLKHNFFKLQNPVTLKVAIPVLPEKAEWKLNGQVLTLTLPLTETISSLKAKLQDETNMPPAKQKLFYDVSMQFNFFAMCCA